MRKWFALILYSMWVFLLTSVLWVAGNIDVHDYVIYKGLLALMADYWRHFAIIIIPLSLISAWRTVEYSQRMRERKRIVLRLILEISIVMTALGILLNLVNLYTLGPPGQTFASKTAFLFEFAFVMVLSKIFVGIIFGAVIGMSLFVLNLFLARFFFPPEEVS